VEQSTAQHAPTTVVPDRTTRWIGVLFAIGSVCFLVGPFPGFVELVGSEVDAGVFFVGSIFFTAAALLQTLHSPGGLDRWACLVQLVGTLFFNVTTFQALQTGLDANQYDKLVWTPDWRGSICFLVSGVMSYIGVRHLSHRSADWRIAVINLAGCVAFGISAVASYVVPSTGNAIDLAAANLWTSLGALCFLVGALMLLPSRQESA
jgi:hypothetical protein